MKRNFRPALLSLLLCLCLLPSAARAAMQTYNFTNGTEKTDTLAVASQWENKNIKLTTQKTSSTDDSVKKSCTLDICAYTASFTTLTIEGNVDFTVTSSEKPGTEFNSQFGVETLKFEGNGSLTTKENVDLTVNGISLPEGYVFKTGKNTYSKTWSGKTGVAITTPTTITVVKCPHSFDHATDKCTICDFVCYHKDDSNNSTISDEDGKCTVCGRQFTVVSGGSGYDKLSDALAYSGAVKLYKNVSKSDLYVRADVTLDLNGFYVDGKITVDSSYNSELQEGRPFIFTLMDSKESTGTGYVTAITNGGGYVKVQSGYIKTLTLSGCTDESVLSGGKYDKIAMSHSGDYLAGLALLPNSNYYFRYTDTKEAADLSYKDTLEKVEVVKCKHETVSTNYNVTRCKVCNGKIEANVGSGHYTIFEDAYEAAEDGDTIVLVNFVEFDADEVKFAKKITISYGDQNMKSDSGQVLKITGDVTFQGGGIYGTSIEVSGVLTLNGNMQLGASSDGSCTVSSGGKLVVDSGTFEYPLTVKSGGVVKLSGGVYYKGITVESGVTYASLLAEGYAYADNDNDPIKLSNMASGTKVKVISHGEHSYTNGVCDYCGHVCPHTTLNAGVCTDCGGVPYRDGDGEMQCVFGVTKITDETDVILPHAGWYLMSGNLTTGGFVYFSSSGDINLILADDATVTVATRLQSDGALTIYGQKAGNGTLTVNGGILGTADISGYGIWICNDNKNLTIYGGNITATGADATKASNNGKRYSYGIYTTGTVNINGGTVKAVGGTVSGNTDNQSYGIYAATVNINGGTVTATGGTTSGGTENKSYGMFADKITVTGGSVTAGTAEKPEKSTYYGLSTAVLTVKGGTFKLPEGSFANTISVPNDVKLSDLLSTGCAYQKKTETEPMELNDTETSLTGGIWVVSHTHKYGEDGKCIYCLTAKPTSSGGSGSGGVSTSTTTKNEDGSTTVTKTDKTTGTVTETTTTPTGTTVTTVTDKAGNSSTTVSVSNKDAQSGGTVTLPVDQVKPADNSEDAQEITVEVPEGGATVEIPVADPTEDTVIVIVDEEGNETVFPSTKLTENGVAVTLTGKATIKVIRNGQTFTDVKESDYFYKAVLWASSRNITGGMGNGLFGPHENCSRAQLVTFLWRAAGMPESGNEVTMADVSSDTYYTDAIRWAVEMGIVTGYDNGLFGTEDPITREQMAVILYRFAKVIGMDTTQGGMAVREYSDYESISGYARAAVQWAVNVGVMQGYDGKLVPSGECTRGQIVTMLYRLLAVQ